MEESVLDKLSLKRMEVGEFGVEEDIIFMRGNVEVYNDEEETYNRVAPLTIFLNGDNEKLKVIEKSSFMVGKIPMEKIENELFSVNRLQKKLSKNFNENPGRGTNIKFHSSRRISMSQNMNHKIIWSLIVFFVTFL